MAKNINNPVHQGLDSLCGGNDSATARVFGLTRQSIHQWRKQSSIPRPYIRTFCELTGVTVETLLEYWELMEGVNYAEFVKSARKRIQKEYDSD